MGIQPIRKTVVPEIPDKLYFRIGDVARLCEVPAYVLRFWETEFPQLKPNKGGTGQRLYRKRDVEMALRIKSLLYDQGYTIPGARQVFKTEVKARETVAEPFASPLEQPLEAQLEPHVGESAASPLAVAVTAAPAAEAQPASALTAPASDYAAGAEVRRQVKLHALRTELQALLELLQVPPRGSKRSPAMVQAQPRPMRPRLVLEPRPAAPKPEPARQETLRLIPGGQRELSLGE